MWIVDDDEAMRLMLAELLSSGGHRVSCFDDGAAAIRALRHEAPDLMILDLLMPGMSGWEVLDVMQERPALSTVPVAVLTAYGEGEVTPTGRPVIHKPVDADLLERLVAELLAQSRSGAFDSEEAPSDLFPRSRHPGSGLPPKP